MHTIKHWSVAAAALVGLGLGAQALADAGRYDGHSLVHVELQRSAELRTLEAVDAVFLDCHIGVGPLSIVVSPEGLEVLEAAGIAHRVLDEDVQPEIDAQQARMLATEPGGADGDLFYSDWRRLDEIQTRFDDLLAAAPELIARETIGTSLEGRPIHAYRITAADPGAPTVLFNGTQHAREWMSPMTVTYIAENLVEGYDADPTVTSILDGTEVIIVPVVNPDGYVYTYAPGGDRFWRKNRRNNGGGSFGVDLNRNWSVGWGLDSGSSGNPGSETYRGTEPFSEPETTVLSDYMLSLPNLVAHIDFHSFSQLILWPFGYDFIEEPGEDGQIMRDLGTSMAETILSVGGASYTPQAGHDLYLASGICTDWAWEGAGAYSWTIELRPASSFEGGFDPPVSEILPCVQENFAAIVDLTSNLLSGVRFSVIGGIPDLVQSGEPADVDVEITSITAGELDPSTARLFARVGGSGPFTETTLIPRIDETFSGTLPAAGCDQPIEFYFSIESTGGAVYTAPLDAPATVFDTLAQDLEIVIADDFEEDLGWSVFNTGGLTDGAWDRGVPAGGGERADPPSDADGSGACYLTDNVAGNSDVDGGTTSLVSPIFDGSDPDAEIAYDRWFHNSFGSSPFEDEFVVEISDDGGSSWVALEIVGPAGDEVSGGWFHASFRIGDIDGIEPGSSMRVRFNASDLGSGSVVEAGVDGFVVRSAGCDAVPGDLDGDGIVGTTDLLALLSAWGDCAEPCPPACDADLDGDCTVGTTDLLTLLSLWG